MSLKYSKMFLESSVEAFADQCINILRASSSVENKKEFNINRIKWS